MDETLRHILDKARIIACVGLSPDPDRTSHRIAAYMAAQGYRVIPVNPVIAGETVLSEIAVASVSDIAAPVDIVNVFRRSEHLSPLWSEVQALAPATWWTQLGVVDNAVAENAREAGWTVVQDRCLRVEHARLTG
ncbi:MAG: CoA-binding protein [Shimia sp.]